LSALIFIFPDFALDNTRKHIFSKCGANSVSFIFRKEKLKIKQSPRFEALTEKLKSQHKEKIMDILWEELTFGLPESKQVVQFLIRIIASALLGGIIGIQREKAGKPAGVRTHILVSLGTTVVVLACAASGMKPDDGLSRVIQGIVTGVGFIGAGAILKLDSEKDVKGLTTAAGVWMTCAIGLTVGLGELGIALIATSLTFAVLAFVTTIEKRLEKEKHAKQNKIEN
jgi:putative Mg2+ transporter-C (MgtC) family protein